MEDRPSQQRRRTVSRLTSMVLWLLVVLLAFSLGIFLLPGGSTSPPRPTRPTVGAPSTVGPTTSRPMPTRTTVEGHGEEPQPSSTTLGSTPRPPETTSPTVDAPPTTSGLSMVDQLEAIADRELSHGTIAYNPPERMGRGKTAQVEVRVTREISPKGQFTSGFAGDAPIRIESLPVGVTMKAVLTSNDMEVTPIGEPVKDLGSEEPVRWLWEIKPTRSGTAVLYLAVAVLHNERALAEKYWTRRIEIEVDAAESAGSWLARNWEKLVAALPVVAGAIGAVVAFVRARWRRRTLVSPREVERTEVPKGS
jgi:hypothetical protein